VSSLLAELKLAPLPQPAGRRSGEKAAPSRHKKSSAQECLAPITADPSTEWDADEQILIRQLFALDDRLDHALIRRFGGEQPPQALAVIIDNERKSVPVPPGELAKIHRKLWLRGGIPIFYIGWPDKVDVISCADPPAFDEAGEAQYSPPRIITGVNDELFRLHSGERLLDGTFWDDQEHSAPFARNAESSHKKLLEKILDFDRRLGGERKPAARRLLLQTLLIKYLEDRGVFGGGEWFGRFREGARSFLALLDQGDAALVGRFMLKMEERFNGGIFSGGDSVVDSSCVRALSRLVDTKSEANGQLTFWELYSFAHIPVEVISQIYERFADRKKGAIYTPPALVDLILHQVMPFSRLRGMDLADVKIMDPTCGSGIFLVAALQRLFRTWRMQNEWAQPEAETLKVILRNCIFGVDIQADSVHITAFSLALALCEALPPPVIWEKLHFDDLAEKNLLIGDFMEMASGGDSRLPEKVSFIVGNPPFLTRKRECLTAAEKAVPRKNFAYAVLNQSERHLAEGGRFALIQPAGIIANAGAEPFMRGIFRRRQLDMVLDFASIRGLFPSADPKVVALIGTARSPENRHLISHYTFRRTPSANARNVFELDHYDCHVVPQEELEEKGSPWIWRINLLGGGRLKNLARRLASFPTLSDYIEAKGWSMGRGFFVGSPKKDNPAPWLTGKRFLPTDGLTSEGIARGRLGIVRERSFAGGCSERRFTPPMLLIKENESLQSDFWNDGPLAYTDKIVGINAPVDDAAELERLAKSFAAKRKFAILGCRLFGKQSLYGKATAILKADIARIPWPVDGNWDLSSWEKIVADDLPQMADYVRNGQNSPLLRNKASKSDITGYISCFTGVLRKLYPELAAGKTIFENGLLGQVFFFGESPAGEILKASQLATLRPVIEHDERRSLRRIRVLRFYDGNAFVIVKPDRLRYWIRSVAIRDADDVIAELLDMGGF
jgi:hypothetical protein